MNNYDLTENKVFSKNIHDLSKVDVFTGEIVNHPLIKFKDKPEHYFRTKNLYVGTANDVIGQIECAGFGINDGWCDCCGGKVEPWMSYGLCERCITRMDADDNEPFFIKDSKRRREQTPWFIV